jgi:hypothetical protein
MGPVMAKSRKKILVKLKTFKTRYLGVLPTMVSKGKVLVHSNVRPQTNDQIPGDRGFTAWTQKPSRLLVRCDCEWRHKRPLNDDPRSPPLLARQTLAEGSGNSSF